MGGFIYFFFIRGTLNFLMLAKILEENWTFPLFSSFGILHTPNKRHRKNVKFTSTNLQTNCDDEKLLRGKSFMGKVSNECEEKQLRGNPCKRKGENSPVRRENWGKIEGTESSKLWDFFLLSLGGWCELLQILG